MSADDVPTSGKLMSVVTGYVADPPSREVPCAGEILQASCALERVCPIPRGR